jgi:hypothetical protein
MKKATNWTKHLVRICKQKRPQPWSWAQDFFFLLDAMLRGNRKAQTLGRWLPLSHYAAVRGRLRTTKTIGMGGFSDA